MNLVSGILWHGTQNSQQSLDDRRLFLLSADLRLENGAEFDAFHGGQHQIDRCLWVARLQFSSRDCGTHQFHVLLANRIVLNAKAA